MKETIRETIELVIVIVLLQLGMMLVGFVFTVGKTGTDVGAGNDLMMAHPEIDGENLQEEWLEEEME